VITLKKAASPGDPTPHTWYPVPWSTGKSAVINCPQCGKSARLGQGADGHAIADDGTVTPSLICPHAPCPFHDHCRLEGWTP